MFQSLISFLKTDRNYFASCKDEIYERNAVMLKRASVMYTFVLAFYTILTCFTHESSILLTLYIVFDIIHIVLCIIFAVNKRKKNIKALTPFFCVFLEVSVLIFFAVEGAITSRTEHSLYVPIALLLVLLLFIHRVAYAEVIIVGYLLIFGITSYIYKTPSAAFNDILIAVATFISANIGYFLISEMRHSEGFSLLRYTALSHTDQLTGLNNKASIESICKHLLLIGDPFSMMIIDLDNFKAVNDQYGHDIGDEVLREVSKALQANFRTSDHVGRFGGDEFMVLIEKCNDTNLIKARAESLIERVGALTFSVSGLRVQCSIGISMNENNDTEQTLFKKADNALYQAKAEGKGQYKFSG